MSAQHHPSEAEFIASRRLAKGARVRVRWQWLSWLLLWLTLGAALSAMQWGERSSIIRQQAAQLLTQNRVAALLMRTQVQTANTALEAMQRSLSMWLRNPDRGQQLANFHLGNFVDLLPAVRTLSVLDENGVMVLSNRRPIIGGHYAQRSYFQAILRSKSARTIYVSEPYRTASGAWAVNISRSLFDEEGHFRGAVVATLEPDYFLQLMQRLQYADDVVMSLVHEGGRIYVSSLPPAAASDSAQDMAADALFRSHLDGRGRDSVRTESDQAGADPKLKAATTIRLTDIGADSDFIVIAARDQSHFLSEWERETWSMALMFGVLMSASGIVLLVYQRWARQISAQAQDASAELVRMAYHDPLTGAFNRRAFLNALDVELERARRSGVAACLVMLDIDHFKQVNDSHGHDFGDLVLQHFVNVLQPRLRRIDMLGRLGGEEFAILLPGTELAGAMELANRLRLAIEASEVPLHGAAAHASRAAPKALRVTVSMGVTAMRPLDKDEAVGAALKRADQAMYQAKQTGRNRVCSA